MQRQVVHQAWAQQRVRVGIAPVKWVISAQPTVLMVLLVMRMLVVLNAKRVKRVRWVKRMQRALKVKVMGKPRVLWAALSVPQPASIAFR